MAEIGDCLGFDWAVGEVLEEGFVVGGCHDAFGVHVEEEEDIAECEVYVQASSDGGADIDEADEASFELRFAQKLAHNLLGAHWTALNELLSFRC